jgi:hypothetical protein
MTKFKGAKLKGFKDPKKFLELINHPLINVIEATIKAIEPTNWNRNGFVAYVLYKDVRFLLPTDIAGRLKESGNYQYTQTKFKR